MNENEIIGQLHRACTQIRLAIAVYEADVPEDQTTGRRLAEAVRLIKDVQEAIRG